MECRDVCLMLDSHAQGQLSAAQRAGVSAHLNSCSHCADSLLAAEAMAQDRIGPCPPEARSALLASVLAAPRVGAQPQYARRVASIIGLVVAAVLVIALFRPGAAPPESAASARAQESAQLDHRFVDGVHYQTLESPVPTSTADRIEVCEFFMFPCVHCFNLERPLRSWYQRQGGIASLRRVPAIWSETTRLQAQAYFTAQQLGVPDVMSLFFEEIHVNGASPSSIAAIRELFLGWGVERSRFDEVFNSDTVARQMAEAVDLNRRYAITSTPTLAVNGRFVTDPGMAGGSNEDLLAVVDYLVETEYDAACSNGACSVGP